MSASASAVGSGRRGSRGRGQSSVVGVALLLAMTVVALGALTASVGVLIDDHVQRTDTQRVASDFDAALAPVEHTGYHSGRVSFAEGTLRTVDRDLRVLDGGGVVATVPVGGLAFRAGERRVTAVAGAVVRSHGDSAWLYEPPPVSAARDTGVVVVGAARLNASHQSISGEGVTARLVTNVSHERRRFGRDSYRVAIETLHPRAFAETFREQGATVTYRDFDDDGVPSVVAAYPGQRVLYLVDHDMRLEVADG